MTKNNHNCKGAVSGGAGTEGRYGCTCGNSRIFMARLFCRFCLWAALVLAVAWLCGLIFLPDGSWWARSLSSRANIVFGCVFIAALLALGPVLAAIAMFGQQRRVKSIVTEKTATAVLEFTLLFPFAMTIMLVMVQSALLMTGNMVVHYAADRAVRVAVVTIPQEISSAEGRNVLLERYQSQKLSNIRLAAAQALVSISAVGDSDDFYSDDIAAVARLNIIDGDDSSTLAEAARIEREIRRRYLNAYDENYTFVEIADSQWSASDVAHDELDGKMDGQYQNTPAYGPYDDIELTLTHRFTLTVPYANRIFGYEYPHGSGRYVTDITAGAVMINQGWYNTVAPLYDNARILLPR